MAAGSLLSEEGAAYKVLRTLAQNPRPESGLDCLICAMCRPTADNTQLVKVDGAVSKSAPPWGGLGGPTPTRRYRVVAID